MNKGDVVLVLDKDVGSVEGIGLRAVWQNFVGALGVVQETELDPEEWPDLSHLSDLVRIRIHDVGSGEGQHWVLPADVLRKVGTTKPKLVQKAALEYDVRFPEIHMP